MSVTGVLLTYERQMIEWSNSDLKSQPQPGAARLPIEQVVASFQQVQPGMTPTNVAVGSEPDAAVIVSAGQRTFYLDAYSGRLLGEGRQGMRQFMSDMRAWHRWLAYEGEARTTARLQPAMTRTLEGHRKHLDGAARMLESLSHKSVLARGFVMVHREDGSLVRAAKDLNAGDVIGLTFADDHKKAVVDPPQDAAKPKPKPKPGGDQGSLF